VCGFAQVTAQCRDAYFGRSHIFEHPVAVFDMAQPQLQPHTAGLWNLAVVSPHAVNANKPAASKRSKKIQRQNRRSLPEEDARMLSSLIPGQQKTDSAGLPKISVTPVLNVLVILFGKAAFGLCLP